MISVSCLNLRQWWSLLSRAWIMTFLCITGNQICEGQLLEPLTEASSEEDGDPWEWNLWIRLRSRLMDKIGT